MTCFSDSSIFNFPRTNSSEYSQDTREIEIVAARALKNINLLYNEIMSPKDYQSEEPKVINNDLYECASNVGNQQNHYLKSCCSTLLELCAKCDKYISRCSSCNRCNCGVANTNFQKYRNIESHKNIKSSTSLTDTQNRLEVKCTVPEPFSFYDKSEEWQKARESKITKIKEEINAKIDSELKIRVHSKPVPKSTHLPLYKQMVQVDEKRKVERKEKCIDLLNNTKPFNLHTKDSIKAKSSVDLTIRKTGFKATPVPKHILSNKVSEKLQNKEEIRKMLITERAKDLLKQSASPISKKAISHSRSMIDLMNYNKPSDNKESKKNISEITKRLYVKKCNETMKSWNKKVSEVNNHKAEYIRKDLLITEPFSLCKKGLSETESYPFLYFPVRMSNAAMLREKQIRAEILARKEREEKKNNEELMKKKINTDILHKLRNLIPASEWEKEVDEKVKMFRESQMRRKEEYEKELQEIMKRVSEQTLLLERISKNEKIKPRNSFSDKSSEVDEDSQEVNENEKSHKSIRSDSDASTQETKSSTES